MFDEYYHSELAYFRMLAQEFALEYPEVDHMVSERKSDRAVERLLQGAALLTARMRSRLDDDFPEIIHTLFDAMWPQFLRPEPAVTMLQFTPRPNVLRQSQAIRRGTEAESDPVDGVRCPFKTTARVDLHPVQLAQAGISRPHPADVQLKLTFSMTGGVIFDTLEMKRLRLHFMGERATCFIIFFWLTHQLHLAHRGVSVLDSAGEICAVLPPSSIRPVGLNPDEHLNEFQPTLLPGARLLQEYFAFQDKFLGVDVVGLDAVPKERVTGSFDLVFHLGTAPETGTKVDRDNFALGCTPAVNLSASEQRDIPVQDGVTEYRLTAPHEGEIFTVDRVGAFDSRSGQWINYPPLYAQLQRETDKKKEKEERDNPRYQLLRRSDGIEGVEIYLAIRDDKGNPLQPPSEMLHVDITYTNGNRPLRLGPKTVTSPTSSSPEFCLFTNRTSVAPPAPLVVAKDRHWELLSLFTMHPSDLMKLGGLSQLLRACHEQRSADTVLPRVRDVRVTLGSRLQQQTVVPVTHVWIDVDQGSFLNRAEQYLFSRVLAHTFMDRPTSTVATEVTVTGLNPDGTADQEARFHFDTIDR